jgi:hypothetical protein
MERLGLTAPKPFAFSSKDKPAPHVQLSVYSSQTKPPDGTREFRAQHLRRRPLTAAHQLMLGISKRSLLAVDPTPQLMTLDIKDFT